MLETLTGLLNERGNVMPSNRKPKSTIYVYVTPDDNQQIVDNAAAAGMTVSGYMRATALGMPLKAKLDLDAISNLTKLGADQGRLGGLLKMYLSNDDHTQNSKFKIERLLQDILATQNEIKKVLEKIR